MKKELKSKFISLRKKQKSLEGLKSKVDTAIRNFHPEFADKTIKPIDEDIKKAMELESKYIEGHMDGVEEFDELAKLMNEKLKAFNFKG